MRDIIICFVCVVFGLGLLVTASSRLDSIQDRRVEMHLVSTPDLENAPPSLAFATVAMGAFRGLVVDILWMRADKLKEEGQFFDAKQLADWITTLQPRFASVWEFQAWNMAYNISVAMPANQWEERWKWVRNGYELLRDKGIVHNPHEISLYRYLAWIFQHKISYVADDCHKHYKREIALAIRPLVGQTATRDDFLRLAKQPLKFDELVADEGIAKFVAALKVADKAFEDDSVFVENYVTLRGAPQRFAEAAHEVINDYRGTETLEKVDWFARAYKLRNDWKFDIEFMGELNDRYGPKGVSDPNEREPLNWEHPDAHAIYWAELGLKIAGKPETRSIDEKNTDRIVFHALQNLFRSGKMVIYPVPDELPSVFLTPDLDMFDSVRKLWTEKIEKYEILEDGKPKGIKGGYKNMLANAALSFYKAGQTDMARDIQLELRERYPGDIFDLPLLEFLKDRQQEELQSLGIQDAREEIALVLKEAYFRYALHQDNEAAGREKWAKQVYDMYQLEFGDEEIKRVDLPNFEMLKFLAFADFMEDPSYPEYMRKNLMGRIQVEKPELFERLQKQNQIFMENVRRWEEMQKQQ